MALTPINTPAQQTAINIETSVKNILTQAQNIINNGVAAKPAQGNIAAVAAIAAADIQDSLGTNLAILKTLFTTAL